MKNLTSHKGRSALSNRDSRYHQHTHEPFDDGWEHDGSTPRPVTELSLQTARSIISRNRSPDIPFEQSVNPYLGCEHGCIYCYARPTHARLGLSPGLDFETKLTLKTNAAELLDQELRQTRYRCTPLAVGTITDAYQPVERHYQITRRILEVLHQLHHPCSIVTKSALIERDIDILRSMAANELVQISITLTTLNNDLARKLEPRAAAPQRRLKVIENLAQAGIPVSVSLAPLIPALNDAELETLLSAAADRGAKSAQYVLLRLPLEVSDLFEEWLETHVPGQAAHVLSLLRQCHNGESYDARYGHRMRGEGLFAEMIAQRFQLASRRLFHPGAIPPFNLSLFRGPPSQSDLFDH